MPTTRMCSRSSADSSARQMARSTQNPCTRRLVRCPRSMFSRTPGSPSITTSATAMRRKRCAACLVSAAAACFSRRAWFWCDHAGPRDQRRPLRASSSIVFSTQQKRIRPRVRSTRRFPGCARGSAGSVTFRLPTANERGAPRPGGPSRTGDRASGEEPFPRRVAGAVRSSKHPEDVRSPHCVLDTA